MKKPIPKVLVACPSSSRHEYCIDKWIKQVKGFNYPNYDVLVVENSPENNGYADKIKKAGIKVIRHKWNPKKLHVLQMLAECREIIRQQVLKKKYDYLINLDTDNFVDKDYIAKLVSIAEAHNEVDIINGISTMYHPPVPCVFKTGRLLMGRYRDGKKEMISSSLDYFAWNEVKQMEKAYKGMFPCYGIGGGLIKRRVLEKVPYRTHPTFIWGEDCWFYAEAYEKGFRSWCLPSLKIKNENTSWLEIEKSMAGVKYLNSLWLAIGPENPEGVEINGRRYTKAELEAIRKQTKIEHSESSNKD